MRLAFFPICSSPVSHAVYHPSRLFLTINHCITSLASSLITLQVTDLRTAAQCRYFVTDTNYFQRHRDRHPTHWLVGLVINTEREHLTEASTHRFGVSSASTMIRSRSGSDTMNHFSSS